MPIVEVRLSPTAVRSSRQLRRNAQVVAGEGLSQWVPVWVACLNSLSFLLPSSTARPAVAWGINYVHREPVPSFSEGVLSPAC